MHLPIHHLDHNTLTVLSVLLFQCSCDLTRRLHIVLLWREVILFSFCVRMNLSFLILLNKMSRGVFWSFGLLGLNSRILEGLICSCLSSAFSSAWNNSPFSCSICSKPLSPNSTVLWTLCPAVALFWLGWSQICVRSGEPFDYISPLDYFYSHITAHWQNCSPLLYFRPLIFWFLVVAFMDSSNNLPGSKTSSAVCPSFFIAHSKTPLLFFSSSHDMLLTIFIRCQRCIQRWMMYKMSTEHKIY